MINEINSQPDYGEDQQLFSKMRIHTETVPDSGIKEELLNEEPTIVYDHFESQVHAMNGFNTKIDCIEIEDWSDEVPYSLGEEEQSGSARVVKPSDDNLRSNPAMFLVQNSKRTLNIFHSDKSNYKCDECGKCFFRRHSLAKHSKTHQLGRKYICEVCRKYFKQARGLETHLKIHTGEIKYDCNACGKSFSFRSSIINHLAIHSDEIRFKCKVCEKGFTQRRYLKAHLQIHS